LESHSWSKYIQGLSIEKGKNLGHLQPDPKEPDFPNYAEHQCPNLYQYQQSGYHSNYPSSLNTNFDH